MNNFDNINRHNWEITIFTMLVRLKKREVQKKYFRDILMELIRTANFCYLSELRIFEFFF